MPRRMLGSADACRGLRSCSESAAIGSFHLAQLMEPLRANRNQARNRCDDRPARRVVRSFCLGDGVMIWGHRIELRIVSEISRVKSRLFRNISEMRSGLRANEAPSSWALTCRQFAQVRTTRSIVALCDQLPSSRTSKRVVHTPLSRLRNGTITVSESNAPRFAGVRRGSSSNHSDR